MEFSDILFAEKLAQRISGLLENMGFNLASVQFGNLENGFEALVYERANPDYDQPDSLNFYGEYRIRGEAFSKGVLLPNIRELLPNFRIDNPETHYWNYHDAESLAASIEDIAQFIETRLPSWFEAPDDNPAQIPARVVLRSREEVKEHLRNGIANLTSAMAFQQARGHPEIVEWYKHQMEKLKNELAELEQNK